MNEQENFSFPKWFRVALRKLAAKKKRLKSHIAFEAIGPLVVEEFPELRMKYEMEIERRKEGRK